MNANCVHYKFAFECLNSIYKRNVLVTVSVSDVRENTRLYVSFL